MDKDEEWRTIMRMRMHLEHKIIFAVLLDQFSWKQKFYYARKLSCMSDYMAMSQNRSVIENGKSTLVLFVLRAVRSSILIECTITCHF